MYKHNESDTIGAALAVLSMCWLFIVFGEVADGGVDAAVGVS
jgi:hypothetical protein